MAAGHDDYDRVPYWGKMYPQFHPDRLAALGTLLGMRPAPVERCRILELGCGDAVNLVGYAMVLTESEFTGIDLSEVHIAAGKKMAKAIGLENISLYAQNILEDLSFLGEYDYIIAHGLYSWVPSEVQDRMLELCRKMLNPQGIAFVSYNTYPGAHLRMMIREMMLFHTEGFDDPTEKTRQAGALLDFLQTAAAGDDPYLLLMKKEAERVRNFPPAHLFHDDLAPFNRPVYFHQFLRHAEKFGLRFLTESDYHETQDLHFTEEAAHVLKTMEQKPVIREQYIDFLRCRRFRQTLLCRSDIEPVLGARAENILDLRVAAQIRPEIGADEVSHARSSQIRFEKAGGGSFVIDLPLFRDALEWLGRIWPRSIPLTELTEKAMTRVRENGANPGEKGDCQILLAELFLRLHAANIAELHTFEPPYALSFDGKPLASPLARLKIHETSLVPNLRHFNVCIDDPLTRHILPMLDGTRDLAELAHEIMPLVLSGKIFHGQNRVPEHRTESMLREKLAAAVSFLSHCGLLMENVGVRP